MFEIVVTLYLAASGESMTAVMDRKYDTYTLCDRAAQKNRDHVYAAVVANPMLTANASINCRAVKR